MQAIPFLSTYASRAIRSSVAVLDVSAGDSFADLYGSKRFDYICLFKEMAIQMKKPLILLPQTYGPFVSKISRDGFGFGKSSNKPGQEMKSAWRSCESLRKFL